MKIHRFNWPIWAGFLLSVIAFLSYFFVFVSFPVTRDFPWANLMLFALAAVLLMVGVRRAFAPDRGTQRRSAAGVEVGSPPGEVAQSRPRRSKIAGAILAAFSVAIFAFFIFSVLIMPRWLPASHQAPQVGQQAPDFSLADTNGKPVSLSELLSSPVNGKTPKGVLLIFYRGYW